MKLPLVQLVWGEKLIVHDIVLLPSNFIHSFIV